MESDILASKKSLGLAEKSLKEAESAYPFDSNAVIQAQLAVEGYKDGLKRLELLKKKLFAA